MNLDDVIGFVDEFEGMPRLAHKSVVDGICANKQELSLFGAIDTHGEPYAVRMMGYFLKHSHGTGFIPAAIPLHEDDLIKSEFSLKLGRADMVVFHVDGSASVIEVKDGLTGYRSVVAGIGQVSMYACQLGLKPGSISAVRRVLAWDAMKDPEHNRMVSEACLLAGVIPVKLPSREQIKEVLATLVVSRRGRLLDQMAGGYGYGSYEDLADSFVVAANEFASLVARIKAGKK